MINNSHVMIEVANDISSNEFQAFLTRLHQFIVADENRHITSDLKVIPGFMEVPSCSHHLHLFELGKELSQLRFSVPETPFQAKPSHVVKHKKIGGMI